MKKSKTPPLEHLRYQRVDFDINTSKTEGNYTDDLGREDEPDIERANIITSRVWGRRTHKILLDIDIPAKLIPSSTPGHTHLYIDKEVSHADWEMLILALKACGVIEEGYAQASLDRGYSALRLPWVKK